MRIIDPADIFELLFLQTSLVETFISWKMKNKWLWNLHGLLTVINQNCCLEKISYCLKMETICIIVHIRISFS